VYGLVTIPQHLINTITNLTGQHNMETITTVGGDHFSGMLNVSEFSVTIRNGASMKLRKDMLERIDLPPGKDAGSASVPDVVVMRNGDMFQGDITNTGFALETTYGSLDLKKATVEQIEFTGKNDTVTAQVQLNNQEGVANVVFKSSQIEVRTRAGQNLVLDPAQVQQLATNTVPSALTSGSVSTRLSGTSSTAMSQRVFSNKGLLFTDVLSDSSAGPEMIVIPAGVYQMGSAETVTQRDADEVLHSVTISRPFAIGRYEITFAEYDRFAEASGREKPYDQDWGRDRHPVVNISWYDADAYAQWLSEQTGRHYRLPTEAEWEYAARAGSSTVYWWGDTFEQNMIVCKDCSEQWDKREAAPVGLLAANGFGLYDVLGNVWEWTCSVYDEHFNGAELRCAGTGDDTLRVIRGGSYLNQADRIHTADRDTFSPADHNELVGFRLARDL
jgi:formylglycine-generating enzyme required for sulfatase activity